MTEASVQPHPPALRAAFALVVIGCVVGAALEVGDDVFKPRVSTVDALAGLMIGAFFVDRLITFVPVFAVRKTPAERAADLNVLRLGYGALLGGMFVAITNLPAVQALTDGKAGDVSPEVDRAIAVLAIAGGVAGLAQILSALNPKAPTADVKPAAAAAAAAGAGAPAGAKGTAAAASEIVPPPSYTARLTGFAAVAIAGLAALLALGDTAGTELLGAENEADGTVALVVRFATVLLAAAIVEQIVERTLGQYYTAGSTKQAKADKPLMTGALALVLGVLLARVMDLYLLHNVGFFGTTDDLNSAIEGSKNIELWFDTFVTGAVIASTTKPLHDLGARLRKVKKPAAPAA